MIREDASLTLQGNLTLSARYVSGPAILCEGTFNLADAVVIKDGLNTTVIDVYGEEASAFVRGGSIESNKLSNDYCAPVRIRDGAKLVMTGGKIQNNSLISLVNTSSAGVLVNEGGTFIMSGGDIQDNHGVRGSGVMVYNRDQADSIAKFIMTGGSIHNNTSSGGSGVDQASGAVHVEGYALFELKEDGIICENQAIGGMGGGVCVVDPGIQRDGQADQTAFKMTGGTISGNNAQSGGGIYSYTDDVVL